MKTGKAVLRWTGVLSVAAILLVFGVKAYGVGVNRDAPSNLRPDAITISIKAADDLEFPPVVFLHDTHTEALKKVKKDCLECHPKSEEGVRSIRFKRTDDVEPATALRDLYHDGCIACHKEMEGQVEKTGPVECRLCHGDRDITPAQAPMGFDKSIHFRHVKAAGEKCETCHHEYDKQTEKLVYVKGNEGACLYCHKDVDEENRIAMKTAAHQSCLVCHEQKIAEGKKAGPIGCTSCHDPAEQAKIEMVKDVPRLQRNQPDALLVANGQAPAPGQQTVFKMNAVAFDHAAHEQYNDTCKVCHHAEIKACADCHTIKGSADGNYVRLETALHSAASDHSCVGCHQTRQKEQNCAGCHGQISPASKLDEAACITCHNVTPDQAPAAGTEDRAKEMERVAQQALWARKGITGTYPEADIPETVTIGVLSKDYEPAVFPHRKVVNAIAERVKDSKMAMFFHPDQGTLCRGCHHNSPPAAKPPSCVSCHGKPFNPGEPLRPGLKGAYHLQCINCHENMKVNYPAATDCTDCHKKKEM